METLTSLVRPNVRKAAAVVLISLSATLAFSEDTHPLFPLNPTFSTIPSNGDVNPYGVAFKPRNVVADSGLKDGDILVSNFNNAANLQGLGTSITRINYITRQISTFYITSSKQTGLTGALGILTNGYVLVGNLPTLDGTSNTVQPGSLSVLDSYGHFLGTLGSLATVNGPWGMAVDDRGKDGTGKAYVFVSNVLSGEITRFNISYTPKSLTVNGAWIIANNFTHRTDPAAIVLGPSGLLFDHDTGTLYVASSTDNAIYTIPDAANSSDTVVPKLFFQDLAHLRGPLDLAFLPNGHLLVANSDGSNADPNQPSELVEYTSCGEFISEMPVDPNTGGAFGIAVQPYADRAFRLAAVDDNATTLTVWTAIAQ